MSLRIAPPSSHSTSATNTSSNTAKGAPSVPGLHDTLRSSLSSTNDTTTPSGTLQLTSSHPLESRLTQWQATQDALKMNILRRNFGIAEPVRRGMEAKICKEGEWRPACLGGSAGVSGEVLAGRDTEISWEDVYRGDESREATDFHTEMEGKVGMERW